MSSASPAWPKIVGGGLLVLSSLVGLSYLFGAPEPSRGEEDERDERRRKDAVALCSESVRLNAENKAAEALEKINGAIELCPAEPRFYTNRALILMKKRKYAQAAESASTAMELDGGVAKNLYLRGRARLGMGDDEGAMEDFTLAQDANTGRGADEKLARLIAAKIVHCRVVEEERRLAEIESSAPAPARGADGAASALAAVERALAEQQHQAEERKEPAPEEEGERWEGGSMESSMEDSLTSVSTTATASTAAAADRSWSNVASSPSSPPLFDSADAREDGDAKEQ